MTEYATDEEIEATAEADTEATIEMLRSGGVGWECAALGLPPSSPECKLIRDGFSAEALEAYAVDVGGKGAAAVCVYFGAAAAAPACKAAGEYIVGAVIDGLQKLFGGNAEEWAEYKENRAKSGRYVAFDTFTREVRPEALRLINQAGEQAARYWNPEFAGRCATLEDGSKVCFPSAWAGGLSLASGLAAAGAPWEIARAVGALWHPEDASAQTYPDTPIPYPHLPAVPAVVLADGSRVRAADHSAASDAALMEAIEFVGAGYQLVVTAVQLGMVRAIEALAILQLEDVASDPDATAAMEILADWDNATEPEKLAVAETVGLTASKMRAGDPVRPAEQAIYTMAAGEAMRTAGSLQQTTLELRHTEGEGIAMVVAAGLGIAGGAWWLLKRLRR